MSQNPKTLHSRVFSIMGKTTFLAVAIATGSMSRTAAQTLDEQYEYFLETRSLERCAHLGFERDGGQMLVAGQAGPNLYAYCNGPASQEAHTPGTSVSTVSSGGASAGGASSFSDDAMLRKRREGDTDGTGQQGDTGIARLGRLGLFMTADYAREKHNANVYQAGQRAHREGFLIGSDYRFDSVVLGLALKHQRNQGDFDKGGGVSGRSKGLAVYGTWHATGNMSVDISLGQDLGTEHKQRLVGRQRIYRFSETVVELTEDGPIEVVVEHEPRIGNDIAPQTTWGKYRSQARFIALSAQRETHWQRYSLGYRLALHRHVNRNSGYTETGETPMALAFDTDRSPSLRSTVGVSGRSVYSFAKGVWIVQANVDWLREFRDQQPWLTAHFAEDLRPNPAQLRFLGPAPERDWLQVSLGNVIILPGGISAFGLVERTLFHQQMRRTGASLGLRLEL